METSHEDPPIGTKLDPFTLVYFTPGKQQRSSLFLNDMHQNCMHVSSLARLLDGVYLVDDIGDVSLFL